jgi:competence protein ComEC
MLREQGVVTLALTPLGLLLFGQASVVGLVANLLAIPWVTLVVTPLALLGVLWAPLWALAAALARAGAGGGAGSGWRPGPGQRVAGRRRRWGLGVAAVLGGWCWRCAGPGRCALLGAAAAAAGAAVAAAAPAPGQFELLAADVGQGNAVLVRTATHTLLYDAGPRYGPESDAGHRVLVPLLRALGERVDTAHAEPPRQRPHRRRARRAGGSSRRRRALGSIEDGHELQALRPATPLPGRPALAVGRRGVRAAAPEPRPTTRAGSSPTRLSCVLRVRAAGGGQRRCWRATSSRRRSRPWSRHGPNLRADLLLAPHHGSKTARRAPAFLARCSRAGCWPRPVTATALATRPSPWCSATRRWAGFVATPRLRRSHLAQPSAIAAN